jgi:hypothetical protein
MSGAAAAAALGEQASTNASSSTNHNGHVPGETTLSPAPVRPVVVVANAVDVDACEPKLPHPTPALTESHKRKALPPQAEVIGQWQQWPF